MRLRSALFLILSLAFLSRAWAQPWVRTYPLRINEFAAVCTLADGGYAYASTMFNGTTGNQVLVIKAKANGLGVWGRTFDAPLSSAASGCRELKDGGILVWGVRTPECGDKRSINTDAFLLTLSESGQIVSQWEYGVDDPECEYGMSQVVELAGGGFIACGEIEHYDKSAECPDDESKGWIIKLDAAGKILWQKTITLTSSDSYNYVDMRDIREAAGGGYLCLGWYNSWTKNRPPTNLGIVVLRFNAAGTLIWQKAFDAGDYPVGGKFGILAQGLFTAEDGGFLITGMDWYEKYPWCARLNKDSSLAWARSFTAANQADEIRYRTACPTKDEGCLIGGAVYPRSGDKLGWFAKIGPTGVLQVNRSYALGGHTENHFLGLAERPEGGFVLVGRSYDDYSKRELWAMTTRANGLTCPGVKPDAFKAVMKTFKLYPKTAALKFEKGKAEASPGIFKAGSVSVKSKSW